MVASLYAVAERAALSAHTPWETQRSDPRRAPEGIIGAVEIADSNSL
jgi:hypothetical protein